MWCPGRVWVLFRDGCTLLKFNSIRPWKYTETQKERIVFQPSFFRGELLNFIGVVIWTIIRNHDWQSKHQTNTCEIVLHFSMLQWINRVFFTSQQSARGGEGVCEFLSQFHRILCEKYPKKAGVEGRWRSEKATPGFKGSGSAHKDIREHRQSSPNKKDWPGE